MKTYKVKAIELFEADGVKHLRVARIEPTNGLGDILDIGTRCRFFLDDLIQSYPFEQDLCVDQFGFTNNGRPLYLDKETLNEILRDYKDRVFLPTVD